jgi:hypothetical protein
MRHYFLFRLHGSGEKRRRLVVMRTFGHISWGRFGLPVLPGRPRSVFGNVLAYDKPWAMQPGLSSGPALRARAQHESPYLAVRATTDSPNSAACQTRLNWTAYEHYSKPHVIEKKKRPLAASNASR